MKLTKIEIAKYQLDNACELYLSDDLEVGDLVSMVTLAGAAEEILGVALTRVGEKNSLKAIHDSEKQADPARTLKETADSANSVRNALKHFNDPNEVDVEFLPGDALVMLSRALDNYISIAGDASDSMLKALLKLQQRVGR